MIIQHNIASINTYRNVNQNNSKLQKDIEQLATGYRINSAADDASGLAISEKMRAKITALGRADKNVQDGISLIEYAEAVLDEVHKMLDKMLDLSLQSLNSTYSDEERKQLEDEHKALKMEIDRIGESANFNGISLFNGADIDGTSALEEGGRRPYKEIDIFVGDTSKDYDTVKVILEKMNTHALGIASTTIANQLAAQATANSMKEAISMLSQDRGRLGAVYNRLGRVNNYLGVSVENIIHAESRVRDADMAKKMMDYTKHKILTETAVSMLAQADSIGTYVLEVVDSGVNAASAANSASSALSGTGGSASSGAEYKKAAEATSGGADNAQPVSISA